MKEDKIDIAEGENDIVTQIDTNGESRKHDRATLFRRRIALLGLVFVVLSLFTGTLFLAWKMHRHAEVASLDKSSSSLPISASPPERTLSAFPSVTSNEAVPSPSDVRSKSSTWRLFTDHKYLYSLSYPSEWSTRVYIDNSQIGDSKLLYVIDNGVEVASSDGEFVYINSYRNPDHKNIVDWLQTTRPPAVTDPPDSLFGVHIPNRPNAYLGGLPAVQLDFLFKQASSQRHLYAASDFYVYEVVIPLDDIHLLDTVYVPIVSSFTVLPR